MPSIKLPVKSARVGLGARSTITGGPHTNIPRLDLGRTGSDVRATVQSHRHMTRSISSISSGGSLTSQPTRIAINFTLATPKPRCYIGIIMQRVDSENKILPDNRIWKI